MKKLNTYQKLLLTIYGIIFIFFSVVHVPFKTEDGDEIIYDTLFSQRANLDIARLLLILAISTIIFLVLFMLVKGITQKLSLPALQKKKIKVLIYFVLVAGAMGFLAFLLFSKNQNKSKDVHTSEDSLIAKPTDYPTTETKSEAKPTDSIYRLQNINSYSTENFEDFISFTFVNKSKEAITNIMFNERFFPVKNKKDNLTNKKVLLNPNDSLHFVFAKDHDEMFIYKLRFLSGRTLTFDDGPFNFEYQVYTKFGENIQKH